MYQQFSLKARTISKNFCIRVPCALFATLWVKAASNPVSREHWSEGDLLAECLEPFHDLPDIRVQLFVSLDKKWVPIHPHPGVDRAEVHIYQ